jgi:Spy/CpxP family protein refolding chaperone
MSSVLLTLVSLISSAVYAQDSKDVQGDGMMPHGAMHKTDETGHSWKAGLTDEQQAEIDWITLRVSQKQQLLDAQISVKEAELNQLIVGEDVTQEQWHAKLDELLQLKREYMLNKYQRLIEVRQVLTPQQRVAFDLEVFSR